MGKKSGNKAAGNRFALYAQKIGSMGGGVGDKGLE